MGDVDGALADFVGCPHRVAGFHAAAGQPHGHALGVVVAANFFAAAHAVVGRAAELAGPKHQRLVQHAALAQVADERGDRLIGHSNARAVRTLDVIVRVPTARVDLHEANALFHEPPGEQALSGELIHFGIADAVRVERALILLLQIDNVRHLRLHAKRQLVRLHPRGEVAVMRVLLPVRFVQLREQVEVLALVLEGLCVTAVAARLYLSTHTVRNHLSTIYRRLGDQSGCMNATNDLAHVHFVRGEYDLAAEHLCDAVELAEVLGDQNKETALIGNLGRIYLLQGKWEIAEQALFTAFERAKTANREVSAARNLLSLGYLAVLRHDFASASSRLDQALALIDRSGITRERAIHYEYSGWWHFEQRHWIQAKEDFRAALEIGRRMSLENDLVSQSMRGLAECEAALGDWTEAARLAEEGLSIALEIEERCEVGCLYRVLAEAQAQLAEAMAQLAALERLRKKLQR